MHISGIIFPGGYFVVLWQDHALVWQTRKYQPKFSMIIWFPLPLCQETLHLSLSQFFASSSRLAQLCHHPCLSLSPSLVLLNLSALYSDHSLYFSEHLMLLPWGHEESQKRLQCDVIISTIEMPQEPGTLTGGASVLDMGSQRLPGGGEAWTVLCKMSRVQVDKGERERIPGKGLSIWRHVATCGIWGAVGGWGGQALSCFGEVGGGEAAGDSMGQITKEVGTWRLRRAL